MKKIAVLVVVFSLLFFACDKDEDSVKTGKFWAQNISDNSSYRVDAELLVENDFCYVWAEKGSGVTEQIAQKVADAYKNDIYYQMMHFFGYMISLTDNGKIVAELNTIRFANYLATGNSKGGKLTILLLDIKDDYQKGVNDSYVAGYFWAGNFFKNGSQALQGRSSNECDMIYVDTFPGIPGSRESNETLAHELQHLMNFVSSYVSRVKDNTLYAMDLWIDEGLSTAAEWVYWGEHSAKRLANYNDDISGLIAKGNNFFVWGNREKENQYAVLDDYSTAYLFFQWLRLHSNESVYKKISVSEYYDYRAVIDAFNDTDLFGYSDWSLMLEDWLAANYFRNLSDRYGYKNDTVLISIKRHYAPGSAGDSPSISLFPGEGVYSNVDGSFSIPTAAGTGNIKYARLTGSAPTSSGSISSGALLTYNANTDNISGAAENGKITGKTPPPSTNIVLAPSGSRSIVASMGPFPIGAGDMLRRKGKGGFNFNGASLNVPNAYRGIIADE
jgi:hypothetical protein